MKLFIAMLGTVFHLRKDCPQGDGDLLELDPEEAAFRRKYQGIKRICLSCRKSVIKVG